MVTQNEWAVLVAILSALAPVGLLLASVRRKTACPPSICAVGILGVLLNWSVLYGLHRALPAASPLLLPVAGILVAGGICALVETLRRQEERTREATFEEQRRWAQSLTQNQTGLYQQTQAQLEELRELRHDLRHYLVAVDGLPGRYAAAAQKQLAQPVPPASVLDAVVEHYSAQAKALGATADIRLELGELGGIAVSDLCLVVGNLLENAVEAITRQGGGGLLRMRCAGGPGWLSIVAGNTFSGSLRTERGGFLSSKAEHRRGRGLESVRRVAGRYDGKAQFTADGRMFTASVFLVKPWAAADPGESNRDTEDAPEAV